MAGPFSCPVQGAAYSDDYGGPNGHPGIDMFVPTGTPAAAVKAGSVTFAPNEGAGGNAAYLAADDGNTYYYAHFSQYVGGPRAVAKGEVFGLTGMTGNATAPAPALRDPPRWPQRQPHRSVPDAQIRGVLSRRTLGRHASRPRAVADTLNEEADRMSEATASRVSRLAAKRGPSAPERSDESG